MPLDLPSVPAGGLHPAMVRLIASNNAIRCTLEDTSKPLGPLPVVLDVPSHAPEGPGAISR